VVPEVWLGTDGVNSGQNVITTLAVLNPGQLTVRKDETRDWTFETFTWDGYTQVFQFGFRHSGFPFTVGA